MTYTRRIIPKLGVVAVFASLSVPTFAFAQAASPPPVLGRWDFVVTGPEGPYPSWLELTPSGRGIIVGRWVGRVGSARPIGRAEWSAGTLRFAIPPQWEER